MFALLECTEISNLVDLVHPIIALQTTTRLAVGDGKVIVVASPALRTALGVLKSEEAKASVSCCLGALHLLLLCGDVEAYLLYE